jgi:hypothetical protein
LSGEPEGTVIALESGDNQIARFAPGERNSFDTAELLRALREPSVSLWELLQAVQSSYYLATEKRQTPYLYGFLSNPLWLRRTTPVAPAQADVAAEAWPDLSNSESPDLMDASRASSRTRPSPPASGGERRSCAGEERRRCQREARNRLRRQLKSRLAPFSKTREKVFRDSGRKQHPYTYGGVVWWLRPAAGVVAPRLGTLQSGSSNTEVDQGFAQGGQFRGATATLSKWTIC